MPESERGIGEDSKGVSLTVRGRDHLPRDLGAVLDGQGTKAIGTGPIVRMEVGVVGPQLRRAFIPVPREFRAVHGL
ncbi:hypothetical protein WT81_11300 [Burkholderia stagnalis]|nr:hypothetical protein WT80_13910 [Burkholderia stagnalis]KWK61002.1 hypothetical protein WT81_11300 [Burkholderia stagnalis]